ncbi:MAG: hypothetical protein IPM53_22150 [Anaerolineaceae bacterium]|nr:hypothetical protein [Anaerolineaceae bacterium]
MQAIEFQTTVKKIVSAMPEEKRNELDAHTEDETVRVIVLTSAHPKPRQKRDLLQDAKDKGYEDFFEYLMDHPLDIPNPIRYTRDELHER